MAQTKQKAEAQIGETDRLTFKKLTENGKDKRDRWGVRKNAASITKTRQTDGQTAKIKAYADDY